MRALRPALATALSMMLLTSCGRPEVASVDPARLKEFAARYRPVGLVTPPVEGTLEHFLTERYCLFTVDSDFHAYSLDIHHPRWPLQTAEAEIRVNTMADAAGIRLPTMAPLLHFSKRQDMVAWPLERVGRP